MPASSRRRVIAARCQLTGESRAAVAPLIGRDGSHGLDDCTEVQRRFRAQLALFLLDPRLTKCRPVVRGRTGEVMTRMWSLWATVDRFLPGRDALVVRTNSLAMLRREFGGAPPEAVWVPGLRYLGADRPGFLHLPTGAVLGVQVGAGALPTIPAPDSGQVSRVVGLSAGEQRLLGRLPSITVDAQQLLAALLVRLPLADPDGIWALSKRHLGPDPDPDLWSGAYTLAGTDSWWHFRWGGPVGAFDIAAALTDTRTGLAGASAVLRPGFPLTVSYGSASLVLLGPV